MIVRIHVILIFLSLPTLAMERIEPQESQPLLSHEQQSPIQEIIQSKDSFLHHLPSEITMQIFVYAFKDNKEKQKLLGNLRRVCWKFNILTSSRYCSKLFFGYELSNISQFYFEGGKLLLQKLFEKEPEDIEWAMDWAIDENNEEMVRDILSLKFDPNLIYGRYRLKATATCRASSKNKQRALQALLDNLKTDPNIADSFGYTPLMLAAMSNARESATLLLNHRFIDISVRKIPSDQTALSIAIAKNHPEIIEMISQYQDQQHQRSCRICPCSVQ